MTEAEWQTSEGTAEMRTALALLGETSQRRLRLVGCACCRRLWKLMTDKRSRGAVEGAELFIENQLSVTELQRLSDEARRAWETAHNDFFKKSDAPQSAAAAATYTSGTHFDVNVLSNAMGAAVEAFPKKARKATEKRCQAMLLRDIFGNPFRSVVVNPAWLTLDVRTLAESIYQDRAFDRMPILADALQDAGCANTDILNHCRDEGPHVRGCWVVDLLTGRK